MKKFIVFSIAALAFLFGSLDTASATWHHIHASNAQAGDESVGSAVIKRYGSGLEVSPAWAASTWIHFAVPTIGDANTGVQLVNLKFNIATALNSQISRVRIYNGNALVKNFTVNWNTTGFQSKILDLGSIMNFSRGLGISVEITAGPDSGTDKIILISAAANFVPKP